MIAVVLCAGFATRMRPLTDTMPKPLLRVADRAVLDYLMDQIVGLPDIEAIHIVSNGKFFNDFCRWLDTRESGCASGGIPVQIHNDFALGNRNRLGAAADLHFVLEKIDRPGRVLVSAGDNIYRFAIQPLWQQFRLSAHHHVVALPETDRQKLMKTGVLELEATGRVLRLHEKPRRPISQWTCPPLYFFQPSVWQQLERFLKTPGNHDAPGHFIDYLCRREAVDAFRLRATRLDIGSTESYLAADRLLRQHTNSPGIEAGQTGGETWPGAIR